MLGAAYEPPFPFIPASEYGEKGHTVLPGRLRHRRGRHRHRPHRDRVRRGRLPARRRAGPQRRQPGAARRHLRRAHRPVRGPLGQGRRPRPGRGPARRAGGCCAPRPTALLPALLALRHAADLLRQADLVHPHVVAARPAARRQRDRRLAPGAHQARPLRQAGWRTTSTGRCRASATGARRCRSGATRRARRCAIGSLAELEELSGVKLDDPHRPFVDDVEIPSPSGGEPLRRVPEVIDVWFDSGSMPFAQCHAPFENQDKFEAQLPGRLHLRGDRPDARLVLLAARDLDAAVRPVAVPHVRRASGISPIPTARRCPSRSATSSCRGT